MLAAMIWIGLPWFSFLTTKEKSTFKIVSQHTSTHYTLDRSTSGCAGTISFMFSTSSRALRSVSASSSDTSDATATLAVPIFHIRCCASPCSIIAWIPPTSCHPSAAAIFSSGVMRGLYAMSRKIRGEGTGRDDALLGTLSRNGRVNTWVAMV